MNIFISLVIAPAGFMIPTSLTLATLSQFEPFIFKGSIVLTTTNYLFLPTLVGLLCSILIYYLVNQSIPSKVNQQEMEILDYWDEENEI